MSKMSGQTNTEQKFEAFEAEAEASEASDHGISRGSLLRPLRQ